MKPGDLIQSFSEHGTTRYIHLNWEHNNHGLIGKTHPFTIGIYLERKIIYPPRSGHQIFYKTLTSDGITGWLPQNWIKKIK